MKKWSKHLSETYLKVGDNFDFNEILGDNLKIRDWQFNGLPTDQFSISNAIIIDRTLKNLIFIDPQL